MELRIKQLVDELFKDAPRSGKALELRDEMEQNLLDRYADLIAEGRSPEEAYNEVANSVGDMSELFAEVERGSAYERRAYESQPQQSTRSEYAPPPETVEDIQQNSDEIQRRKNRRRILRSVNNAMWLLIVAVYFLISFASGAWHITWVIFLIGGALSTIISVIGAWGGESWRKWSAFHGALWWLVVAVYFLVSFTSGAWHITWVIFLIGAALSSLLGLFASFGRK